MLPVFAENSPDSCENRQIERPAAFEFHLGEVGDFESHSEAHDHFLV